MCGRDNNATFLCQFQGSVSRPRWIINSTEYSSINSELPPDHYYSSHSLTVTNINDKNGTRYQCQLLVFEDGELCAYKSTIGQLIYRCPRGIVLLVHSFLCNIFHTYRCFQFTECTLLQSE